MKLYGLICRVLLIMSILMPAGAMSADESEDSEFECPKEKGEKPNMRRNQVYVGVPFSAGETARYELRYLRALVGYGTLEVRNPVNYQGHWHRSFHAEAQTGEWYRLIFVAHDKIHALSRPWDFGVSQFYMEQDEGKMFGGRLQRKRWLDFDHDGCSVNVRTVDVGKPERQDSHTLVPGAVDALSAVFKLRTFTYELNKKHRALVYTSEDNWWLEAEPVAFEKLKVEAGTFDTVKLKLKTYLGEELQQKGDVYVWIAHNHPHRPVVRVHGEIKIGAVQMNLVEFKAGG